MSRPDVRTQEAEPPGTGDASLAEPRTEHTVLILADISGYTQFMLASRDTMVHGQAAITRLIEAIIEETHIPLKLKEIEGDAVFMYAVANGDAEAWERERAQVGERILAFFDAFARRIVEMSESAFCQCAVCANFEKLRLKVIVHSGAALFHRVGPFDDVSGIDVILAHRLLKNSVQGDEYLLLTAAARRDIRFPRHVELHPSREHYDGFDAVETFVHYPDPAERAIARERARYYDASYGGVLRRSFRNLTASARETTRAAARPEQLAKLRELPESATLPPRSVLRGGLSGLVYWIMSAPKLPFRVLTRSRRSACEP